MMLVRLAHWVFRIKGVPIKQYSNGRWLVTNQYRVPTLIEAVTGNVWE